MNRILVTGLLCVFFSSIVFADDVKFTATASKVVSVGEQFYLKYNLNAKGSGLKVPSIDGFEILSGPNTSQSSSIQFINGQMTQNVSFMYSYILRAVKEGTYTIDGAEIEVNGVSYKSNSLTIEVVKGNAPATAQPGSTGNQSNIQSSQIEGISGEDLFVRVNVSKTELYQGEHLYATVKVYTRLDLAGFEDMKFPSFNGFWSQDIETPAQVSLVRENVNGSIYNVGVIKKVLLYPQRSGELIIDPFVLDCIVRQQVRQRSRSFFDSFFGSFQNVKKQVKSPEIKIKVKNLPANKPESFNGAVGSFTMNATIDNEDVSTNDAITMTIKVSGNGNLKLIDPPVVNFPPDFEVYDPKITNNINTGANGSTGSKSIEYLIIPRHPGNFRISPVVFSYFDPASKSYKTLSSKEFNIKVKKGDGDESATIVSSLSKEDIKLIGSDIRFIKAGRFELKPKNHSLLNSVWFYLSYPIVLIIFVLLLIVRRKQIVRNANIALVKNKKANKISRKRLKIASSHLQAGKKEEFYEEVTRALWGYLSDKMNIPVAVLSKENATNSLIERKVNEESINELFRIIETCEFCRYAPSSVNDGMESVFRDAENIIGKLEQNLR